jgi:hypothetical protein
MKTIHFAIILSMVSLLTLGISGAAMAAGPVTYTTEQIKVGSAASECSQLGGLLETTFTYAYKWNEAADQGAPDGSETASFPEHSNTIMISNSNGSTFNWSSFPNGISAVLVKAGQGYNVYTYNPQVKGDAGLYAYQNKEISHVTFCWNKEVTEVSEWCSPGYWRQEQHLDSWEATGIKPEDNFQSKLGYYPQLSNQGLKAGATTNPTLWQVLQSPQYYGGNTFNAIGDLLSKAHPDVNFTGERAEDSCPLN